MWFYRSQYKANDTYQELGMEEEELHRLTRHTIRYIQGFENELQITVTINGVEQEFFSNREITHMKDVKNLFQNTKIAAITLSCVFIVGTALLVLFARKRKDLGLKKQIVRGFLYAALIFVGLAAILAIYAAADWNNAFAAFHRLFFSNDFWQLEPTDLMLKMVPGKFFMSAATVIVSFLVFFVCSIIATSASVLFYIKKRERRRAYIELD